MQPKDSAAEAFMHEQLSPMIRATPELRRLIGAGRAVSRRSDDTKTYKGFPGGFLKCTSAGAPDNLARRPIRRAVYDEVNKDVFTKEGNPLRLGQGLSHKAPSPQREAPCDPRIGLDGLVENRENSGGNRAIEAELSGGVSHSPASLDDVRDVGKMRTDPSRDRPDERADAEDAPLRALGLVEKVVQLIKRLVAGAGLLDVQVKLGF